MRALLPLLAVVALSACKEERTQRDPSPDAPAAAARDASSPASALRNADSVRAPGGASAGADGAAELRKLVAAGTPIMIDFEEIAAGEFTVHPAGDPSAYAGEYDFGDSESESTLTLKVEGNAVTATQGYGAWENERWVGKEIQTEGLTISGATLTGPGWSGVFARWQGRPGLIIFRASNDVITPVEFGPRSEISPEDDAP